MNLLNGYIYIPVSNFDEATEWYKNILGFELVFTDKLYRELRSPSGICIMLIERRDGVNS
jgi:catechol 2,3-dioxygenase-like lactoylglutathione lyase family enzyme